MVERVEQLKLQLYLHALPQRYVLLKRHINVVNEVPAYAAEAKRQCPQVANRRRSRERGSIKPLGYRSLAARYSYCPPGIKEIARGNCRSYVVRTNANRQRLRS